MTREEKNAAILKDICACRAEIIGKYAKDAEDLKWIAGYFMTQTDTIMRPLFGKKETADYFRRVADLVENDESSK